MFETLLWDLGAAVSVGLSSLTGSGSNSSDFKTEEEILAAMDEGFELEKYIPSIMALEGCTRSDAIDYARVIHRSLKNGLIIDKVLAEEISEKVKMDIGIVENACVIYRELMFFNEKGITDIDQYRDINTIGSALLTADKKTLKDPEEVAKQYGYDINKVNSVYMLLNEYAARTAPSQKPFTVGAPAPQQSRQPSKKNNNKNATAGSASSGDTEGQ